MNLPGDFITLIGAAQGRIAERANLCSTMAFVEGIDGVGGGNTDRNKSKKQANAKELLHLFSSSSRCSSSRVMNGRGFRLRKKVERVRERESNKSN